MKNPGNVFLVALGLLVPAFPASGGPLVPADSSGETEGEYSVSAFGYWIEGEDFFVLPIATADFGTLHLEARYNYEDFRTGSLFAGYNFTFGSDVEVLLTPMAGMAFGQTNGVVPGLEAEVYYGILGFSLEGEYVFDLEDSEASFLYIWSEFFVSPVDWLFAGIAGQRMRVVNSDLEVSRGVMVGGESGAFSATLYYFDFTEPESFVVLGLTWEP